ncbi:pentapeptide repeat-containing protein [Streptomonospora nanhaiensis]|uniref:Uncharacterized protein YjbI with pentapeptide repeats n=1 Tax=Streptomonospora nanhaiensis TaxID=1323731 RepID=A0A853BNR4_9ACTN|nr:pentapeptide repeat-containing protein [Streptomonospora nanhaiensis]MBV2363873.1 pentapeptide repeat-containing protein [Streptomonospora nanhaiensis]MBX9388241.1 pentapeptide repeat-containing protein [Streptomonospora nanhaiensis]NYI96823.1 uncharacterized protein YjbI with pentapeptide repeats [Streptomonospora nanhaiensis]
METVNVRDVRVLLPDDEEDTHTTWPHADTLTKAALSHSAYSSVDLAGHRWNNVKISRVVFTDCRFTGLIVNQAELTDVLFRDCVFDYAHLTWLRSVSGVAFTGCRFTETVFESCDLSGVAMDGCRLAGVQFDGTRVDGCDLRGSSVEDVVGVLSMRKARIDADQIPNLMASVMAELGWKVDH